MHDEVVDDRIRDALLGNDGSAPVITEGDPVGAVRSRVVRRRRRRRGTVGVFAASALLTVGVVAVASADTEAEDVRTAAGDEPTRESVTTPSTLVPATSPSSTGPGGGPSGVCATAMIEVAAGDGWTLNRGVGDGRPSLYEVSVEGEPVFGGCGSDQGAKAAGHMAWFSGRVGDEFLLFGEVPNGVSAVAVNREVVEAVLHEGADTGLVVTTLSSSDSDLSNLTLEAVRSDGTRTALAPKAISAGSNGFVLVFPPA